MKQASIDRHARRGGALALSLMAVTVVSIIGGSFLLMTATLGRSQRGDLERSQAFYLSEAGLAEAYAALAMGKTGNVGSREAPALYGNGLFWVEATRIGDKRMELTSTGMSGSMRVVLSLVAERTMLSGSALGVFARGALDVGAGSLVDGYDSTLGTYAEQAALGLEATRGGRLGSNAGITVAATELAPTLINGDAAPGPGADLLLAPQVTMTGDELSGAATLEPPLPTPPQVSLLPALVLTSGSQQVHFGAGTYGLEGLQLQGEASVTLEGPVVLVTRELQLQDSSELTFDVTGGRIDIYVLETLSVAPGARLGAGNTDPAQVSVQFAGVGGVDFLTSQPFYGTLYAPAATVTTGAGFELFGSLVAQEIELAPGVRLHFDRALLAQAAGEQALPQILAWRLVDLGPESGGRMSSSPFETLGVDPADLSGPSSAHADQMLDLTYLDLAGATQTYSGAESAFDWDSVSEVLALMRDGELVLLGTEAGEEAQEPEELAPGVEQAVLDLFAEVPELDSSELKNALDDMTPVSPQALAYILALPGTPERLNPSHLKNIMEDHSPLEESSVVDVLGALFENPDPSLDSSSYKDVMLENTPLPAAVAEEVLNGLLGSLSNPMSGGETKDIMIANSPLPAGTLRLINSGRTRLTRPEIRDIMSAQ